MTPLSQAALALAAKGLRVFPCLERGKEPAIADPLRRATIDPNNIAGWWRSRELNIGIATGEGSGIWVLDVDGDEGEATLKQLEARYGKLPHTVEVLTGKGRHKYFRWPTGVEIRNTQCRDDLPGIDVRGNGGYVLAPPSIHPSGRIYEWFDSSDEFADAPDWLIAVIVRKANNPYRHGPAKTPEHWRIFIEQERTGSHRAPAIASLFGYLVYKDVAAPLALGIAYMLDELRNKPPLGRGEVYRICDDIACRELDRRGWSQ